MQRIASFSINHDVLKPGLYLSRVMGMLTPMICGCVPLTKGTI